MKRISLFLGVLIFISAFCFSQEVRFSGDLSTNSGFFAPGTENFGDFGFGNTDFTGTIEAYAGDSSAFLEGNVNYDLLSDELNFDLSEAYIDYSSSFWGIRLGQQKVAWGKADGISITNSVFPKDSSTLFTEDDSVAVKAARLSFCGNSFTVDGYVIPFFTGTKLPLEENNPLRKALVPSSVEINQGGTAINLPVNIGELSKPELNFRNMEYGLKASGYFSFCDVSLYGFYGWDKTPVLNYQMNTVMHPVYGIDVPENLTINGEYKPLTMIGFDAAVPAGALVLRTESAFFHDREFQSSSEAIMNGKTSSVKQQQIMALAGVDWMPSGWAITAQYYGDVLINKSADIERKDSYEHGATLSISKSVFNETLELSASGLVGLNSFDSAISVSAKYSLSDQICLSSGAYAFLPGPEEKGSYGKYKDFSSIYFKASFKW